MPGFHGRGPLAGGPAGIGDAALPYRRWGALPEQWHVPYPPDRALSPLGTAMRCLRRPCGAALAITVTVVAAASAAAQAVAAAAAAVGAAGLSLRLVAGNIAGSAEGQAAEAAEPVTVIPFPSPPPGQSIGRFHTLPSLQCRPHPAALGDKSPDPDAVTNPYGRGGTGWVLQVNSSTASVVIPYGPGTCASPLNDDFQLSYLAAKEEMSRIWSRMAGSTNISTGGQPAAEFNWAGLAFHSRISLRAAASPVSHGYVAAEYDRTLPCASSRRQFGLVCEEEVASLLSLRRNQQGSVLERHRGVYDVLSMVRDSRGVVLDKEGRVVAAGDRVSDASASSKHFAVVMYTTRDGRRRPVLAGEAALLTLGRGVMADPSWLGGSFPGGLSAGVFLFPGRLGIAEPTKFWLLHHGDSTVESSQWLQEVAKILCMPPMSFVVDESFCNGVEPPKPFERAPLRVGGHPVTASLGFSARQQTGLSEMSLMWILMPDGRAVTAPPCPSFDNVTFKNTFATEPLWLLGRGDRELHTTGPAGETELELARHLSSCNYNGMRWDLTGYQSVWDGQDLTSQLSQRFRRDIFQVDPPEDPVSNAGVLLALLVVVPEAAAIILQLLQPRSRQRGSRLYWREGSGDNGQ